MEALLIFAACYLIAYFGIWWALPFIVLTIALSDD